ncbi:MAG: hypothetical protein JWQ72_1812 [Polaromonas sp.]|nr:hypothetical protein [Polaromonas sp.]
MMKTMGSVLDTVQAWKDYDERRDSFPAEHWLMMGLGIAVLLASQRSGSTLGRALGTAAGSAMLYRAASGRDGLARLRPYLSDARKLLPL